MTRASKHTPGPMRVESDGTTIALGGQCVIVGPAPDGASNEEMRANAARIALAWNTHDEMLAALAALTTYLDWRIPAQTVIDPDPRGADFAYHLQMDAALAAIAKARGQSG